MNYGRGRVCCEYKFNFNVPPKFFLKYPLTPLFTFINLCLEVHMEKKELLGLVKKKEKLGPTEVVSLRVPSELVKKLEAKNVDIPETIRNLLHRISEY